MDSPVLVSSSSTPIHDWIQISDNDKPICIFSINDEGTEFTFHEEKFNNIIKDAEKINANKLSIISVVGDFRTGKSFLLDLMLRYLRWSNDKKDKELKPVVLNNISEWLSYGGQYINEGNLSASSSSTTTDNNDNDTINSSSQKYQSNGFNWRGGKERTTTGIWMYGKPFIQIDKKTNEKIPILIMDTQGMFDFHTSKELTAAIFGLSTLISSYQIYNISKQIQEDKMQQLHYFLEFSRVALKEFEQAMLRSKLYQQKQQKRRCTSNE